KCCRPARTYARTDRQWRNGLDKAAGNTAHSSRPQSFPVRIHQEDRGNSIWSLRIDGAAQVVEDFSEARTAGDHLQRSLLRDEKRFYCVAHGHLLTEHGPRGAPASTVRRAERLPEDGQVQICFLYPGLEWDQGHIRRPRESSPLGCPASFLTSLAPKGVPTGAARIGVPTGTVRWLGRCPAIAARTISRTEAFPTAKRVAPRLLSDVHDGRDWTWNRDRDGAEGGFSLASHRDGSGAPLAHACDGKAAVDDVQDRARLRWGAVDHSADRFREVRAPLGDRAPTGDLRSPHRLGPGGSHRSRRQCHPLLGGARAARHRAAQLPGLRP